MFSCGTVPAEHFSSIGMIIVLLHLLPIAIAFNLPLKKSDGQQGKKTITVEQSLTVHIYNKYMGGIDRMDQNISTCRISLCVKKRWWLVFAFLLNRSTTHSCSVEGALPMTLRLDLLE